ncbi:MAG: hypothetical protein PHY93_14420 [Bacteriovorax sp.]|nr:hypothetical protein [Bacteriovorax sp.]
MIDKSGANTAGIKDFNEKKRITNPMMGFQSFNSAKKVLASIEMMAAW